LALLPIRLFGDPVLRERAPEVETFDEALAKLADDMLETMRAAAGAGLAATQVGVLKRLFAWEVVDGDDSRAGAWVNPEVVETSEELQEGEEGCLSFPGLFYPCERPLRARIRARDVHGEQHEVTGEGLLARIYLHEIDHLNGILFIDHLTRHDRKEAMRRIRAGELEQHAAERDRAGDRTRTL
jgi:peptide deformylase